MASAVGDRAKPVGPDYWPIKPTYVLLNHNGEVQKEGMVTQIAIDWVEYPTFSGPGYPDPILKWDKGHYIYTFYWDDGTNIAVAAEDGWSWQIREDK